jgi:hypothetical protein
METRFTNSWWANGSLMSEHQLLRGRSLACRCLTPRVRFCGDMEYDEHSTGSSLSGPTAHSMIREPLTNAESFDRVPMVAPFLRIHS